MYYLFSQCHMTTNDLVFACVFWFGIILLEVWWANRKSRKGKK